MPHLRSINMGLLVLSGLSLLLLPSCSTQAPGDESSDRCSLQVYPDNERTLMDSYNYVSLLPGNGTESAIEDNAVWNDRSYDENDVIDTSNPTYWQNGGGGACSLGVGVCGFNQPGVLQNNWLFTQHISKDFDHNIYNYPVDIRVNISYSGVNCRTRRGCNQKSFSILTYITNDIQLPSTLGNGYMNRNNYMNNVTITPEQTSTPYREIHNFTLQPSQIGLYVAIQDYGTCLRISRMIVYRNQCPSYQDGMVLYPDAPAPVSDSVPVVISCVDNAEPIGSSTVMCGSDGVWGEITATCGCSPGYSVNETLNGCDICPEGFYQPLVSYSIEDECKPCPSESSADEAGTAVCKCRDGFIRHPDRPDDPCLRSPSPPRFDLSSPPQLDGNIVNLVWLPSADSGGDPEGLYYNVYAAQLNGEDPVFCRQNDEEIDGDCEKDCRYSVTGLDENTPYALLVVAANSATDDPQCVTDITLLDSRYLVLVVGTEDAPEETPVVCTEGLSGAMRGVTITVTFILTTIITAIMISI